jgi:hypothetical protein
MKKFLLLALVLSVGSVANASIRTAKDDLGHTIQNVNLVGADTCLVVTTTPVLCTSGAGFVYGVIASSVATTDYLVIRDSATANTSSTMLVPSVWGVVAGTVQTFPAPAKFTNGLSININNASTGVGGWTVIYKKKVSTD